MWPFKRRPQPDEEDGERLTAILTRCRKLVSGSHDSLFSGDNEEQIGAVLDRAIKALKKGKPLNRRELTQLFRPAGSLQETAQDNGWDREYRALAGEFVEKIRRIR